MMTDDQDFASLLEGSLAAQDAYEPGDKLEARVVHVTDDTVFVDLGGKSEGAIEADEFRDDEGRVNVRVGDVVTAYVTRTGGGLQLSRSLRGVGDDRQMLRVAAERGMTVEGRVEEVVKGGLRVAIGGTRAFCPVSQIDLRHTDDPAVHVGRTYDFRITRYEQDGRNVIVSRRVVLEEAAKAARAETLTRLHVGADLEGQVVSVRDFGAFVDLGGIEGLVHVSELAWVHVNHPAEVVKVGDVVLVRVLEIDTAGGRIGLSIKARMAHPWEGALEEFPAGARVSGRVTRLQPFGAFVELAPGVEGLVHISRLGAGRRIAHPSDAVQLGDALDVVVDAVDVERRRISLSLPVREPTAEEVVAATAKAAAHKQVVPGALLEGTVDRIEAFGVFVRLPGDVVGVVPNAEMGTPRGTDHRRSHPPGTAVRVLVLEVDEARKRYRLSMERAREAAERAEYQEYADRHAAPARLGTLGDLLKAQTKE
jgi:small subunit ribosomal protein S1